MSWLVENLLRDKIKIHAESDLSSDEFNDLLLVESAISKLVEFGSISDYELMVLDYVSDGKGLSNAKGDIGVERDTAFKIFRRVCNKIALYLGGYFTDDGYAEYIKEKYNLNHEQEEKMMKYMSNRFRYKLLRKRKNVKKSI